MSALPTTFIKFASRSSASPRQQRRDLRRQRRAVARSARVFLALR